MKIKTTISAIALAAGLALSGSVYAQTMINGVEVAEGDLAAVQQRCDDLATAAATSDIATAPDADDGTPEETNDDPSDDPNTGAADATVNSQADVNEVANALTSIDLETLTLEACVDAGLVNQ